ncbi:MAG: OsmC family protein [Chloroflexota bacterium]
MKVNVAWQGNMTMVGTNSRNHTTRFDTVAQYGGDDSGPTPMEALLEALAACSMLDVVSILRKKRVEFEELNVQVEGERSEKHPKVFTKVRMIYSLTSETADIKDLERSIELSHGSYCSVSAMFRAAGCVVTHDSEVVKNPNV